MIGSVPTVDDVYGALIERISSGRIEVGSKLPSCRVLADELGSNPSTVNRAIRRLSRHGLVRTEPRVGSFLVNAGAASDLSLTEVEDAVHEAVRVARRSGLRTAQIRDLYESALSVGASGEGEVVFVECNARDLERMSQLIENTTGVALRPMMIEKLRPGWEDEFDVVATPIFHLAGVVAVTSDLARVVELNFVPGPAALRELATLDPSARVGVVAPTERGIVRMTALVSQYYEGAIRALDVANPGDFDEVDVAVYPTAVDLPPDIARRVRRSIRIEWVLDPGSAAAFARRVSAAIPV